MICQKCGWDLRVGDWPYCGNGHDHAPAVPNVITDDYPGGRVFENIDHQEITVYSKSELRRELDKRDLRFTDRYHENDGPDWRGGIDAQTLANAAALVGRSGQVEDDPARLETLEMSIRTVTL